jgi:hypothetical protein
MTHTVTASALRVRREPGGTVLRSLPRGTQVTVVELRDGWARVAGGWVSAEHLAPIAAAPAAPVPPPARPVPAPAPARVEREVTASALRVRRTPGGDILRSIARGSRVTVEEVADGWARIAGGGWVSAEHLGPVRAAPAPPPAPAVPPSASRLAPMTMAERDWLLGHIEWTPAPTADNREAITITNGWAAKHIVRVDVPQLRGIPGANAAGTVWVHRRVRDQMLGLWAAWEKAGLLPLVRSWGGCYVPRLIRGSTKNLSQHAHGSAFDCNMQWNGLGATPAAAGTPGSVRELVPLAEAHGFFWGGHFRRQDGMHFEVADVRGAP